VGAVARVAILGAGGGGCAAAADLSRRGFEVRIASRSAETLAPLRAQGGVRYTGVFGEGFAPVATITTDVAEAVAGADVVMVAAPMMAHLGLAATLAPHLRTEQVLFLTPGHLALAVPSTLRRHGIRQPVTCEATTLPYAARVIEPGLVRVALEVARLRFAAFPSRETARLAERVARLYPSLSPLGHVLESVFLYTNAVHHPPATICNAGRIESTGGDYAHYYDGITPSVGAVIDRTDEERRAIAAALGVATEPFVDYFHTLGYTTEAARRTGLAYEAFHQSEPDRWIKAPSTLRHRYLDEDVPFGLVPLVALARWAGVATPIMDALIELACALRGVDYRKDGLTLERMGLADVARGDLDRLLREGYAA
jgi:opine dehydrogenase